MKTRIVIYLVIKYIKLRDKIYEIRSRNSNNVNTTPGSITMSEPTLRFYGDLRRTFDPINDIVCGEEAPTREYVPQLQPGYGQSDSFIVPSGYGSGRIRTIQTPFGIISMPTDDWDVENIL